MKTKIQRKILKNGLTVIFEKRNLPIVSVAFAVKQGGINENSDEKGISHFIEHMLYKGTPTRNAKQIAEEIERNGGELNGFTSEEITAFWCKMPSKHLDIALEVLSDMVKNPKFDKKEIEKERKVIFEEIKMRKDTPRVYVFDEIQGCLYEKPLGSNLIGTEKTMNSINRDKMIKKYKEVYQPENMILCIVGDANFDEIVDFAEKNFAGEKALVKKLALKKKNESKVEKRKGLDQSHLIFAYHVPLYKNKKNYAAQILSVLMAGGMSSRLFQEIREKRNLAYSVKGDSEISKDFAYNMIYVGTTKEKMDEVKKLILKEFKKITEGLTDNELSQIKEQIIGQHKISMEDSQRHMVNLLIYEFLGNAEDFHDFEKNINTVRIKDIQEIAEDAIKNNSFFVLMSY